MRKWILLLSVIFTMGVFAGCASPKEEDIYVPEDKIILVKRSVNYADCYYDSGWFLDGKGDIYNYDFSSQYAMNEEETEEEFLDRLYLIRTYSNPDNLVTPEKLQEIYREGMKIDPEAQYFEEGVGCDMGQRSITFINGQTDEQIVCNDSGDFSRELLDKHAQNITEMAIGMNNFQEIMSISKVYTQAEIPVLNINCGYMPDFEGNYLFLSDTELGEFEDKTGIQLTAIFNQMESEMDKTSMVYFVTIENVSSTGYLLEKGGLVKADDNYTLYPSKTSYAPGPDDIVGEAMDGFCSVVAFPITEGDFSEEPITMWGGAEWQTPH